MIHLECNCFNVALMRLNGPLYCLDVAGHRMGISEQDLGQKGKKKSIRQMGSIHLMACRPTVKIKEK